MNLKATGIAITCALAAGLGPGEAPPAEPAVMGLTSQALAGPPTAFPDHGELAGRVMMAAATAQLDAAAAAATPVPKPVASAAPIRPRSVTATPSRSIAPAPPSGRRALVNPAASPPVLIPVPLYKQVMNLDCETASLQMALAYRGHYYSQPHLFQYEPVDRRPAVKSANGAILQWGNPFTHFVGDVNAHQYNGTGYGVYYPPILNVARGLGDPAAVGGSGFAASTIYQALATGHPVQVWIEYQWVHPGLGVWKAWDGQKIHYSLHEHTVVLSGVSDTQVRVNDSWPGSQYWVSKATFERSWADFYNMAIIY